MVTKKAVKKTVAPKGNGQAKNRLPAIDAPSSSLMVIPKIRFDWAQIEVVGTSPLVSNRFRESAMADIELKQQGCAKQTKAPRKPEEEFREATHICKGGYSPQAFAKSLFGFPAIGLKAAIAKAAYRFGGTKNIVSVASVLFVHGPYKGLIPIINPGTNKTTSARPTMRRDMVVLQGGKPVASIAYRPEFYPWSMTFDIRYWENVINLESVVNAIAAAGQLVSLGSWRVENGGDKGMFSVRKVTQLPDNYQPKMIG